MACTPGSSPSGSQGGTAAIAIVPRTALYAEFATEVHRAQAEFEIERLDLITAAAKAKPENWRAAAWQLERFAPERYGRRRFVDVSDMVPLAEVRALLIAVVDLVELTTSSADRSAS